MAKAALKLALIGADEPLGEALLRVLEARDIELAEFWPITLDEDEGATITYEDQELACLDLASLDWTRINILVLASPQANLAELRQLAGRRRIPLLSTRALMGTASDPGSAVADAPAAALLRVLKPLAAKAGLASLNAFVGLPVAALGKAGVTELATQSRALFALEQAESSTLPVRIAFNALPVSVGAGEAREADLIAQLTVMLAEYLPTIQTTSIWMPVFHGGVVAMHAQTREPVTAGGLKALWEGMTGLIVMDEDLPGGVPTPATEAVDSDDVFIGRVQVNASDPTRISCWLCFDQPRLEAAQIADLLGRGPVNTD